MGIFIVGLADTGRPMQAIPVTPDTADAVSARYTDFVRLAAEGPRAALQQALDLAKNEIRFTLDWLLTQPLRLSISLRHLRTGRRPAPVMRAAP